MTVRVDTMTECLAFPQEPHEASRLADDFASVQFPPAVREQRARVLVVDDDEAVRETLAELLEDVGFCCLVAASTADALTVLRRQPRVDALITDLTMPGDDGIALIRQAREMNGNLPAILLTGYAEQVAAVATIAGGNFHVLRKPVQSGALIAQLELLVSKAAA